jgi:molecular chaperone GrpE (heat shock protein)
METLEHLYAHEIDEHELIHASNPWGCNQYGHRKGHQGGSSSSHGGSSSSGGESKKKKSDTQSNEQSGDNEKETRETEETSSIDNEVDEFEKSSTSERRFLLWQWKENIKQAEEKYELYLSRNSKKAKTPEYEQEKQRLKGEFEKEVSNFKEKIRKVGKKRGWDDKKIEQTIIGVTMGIRTKLRV